MKQILVFLFLIFSIFNTVIGQSDNNDSNNCFKIQFEHKDSVITDSTLTYFYHPKGFQIIENGVYDFIIDGKKYYQSLLLKIDKSGYWISQNWEFVDNTQIIKDTLHFKIEQNLKVRLLRVNSGIGDFPFSIGKDKYNIQIVNSNKNCRIKNTYISILQGENTVQGHYYFTAYGWKKIRIVKGKAYLCEGTNEYRIRRK